MIRQLGVGRWIVEHHNQLITMRGMRGATRYRKTGRTLCWGFLPAATKISTQPSRACGHQQRGVPIPEKTAVQDALDVELLDLGTVPVNLDQRQFFAKPIALALVRAEVDRLLVDERVIQAIEFLLDRFRAVLSARHLVLDRSLAVVPHAQHGFLEKPHVTRRRLESLQLVQEQPFEFRLRNIHCPAGWQAVVGCTASYSSTTR